MSLLDTAKRAFVAVASSIQNQDAQLPDFTGYKPGDFKRRRYLATDNENIDCLSDGLFKVS